MKEFYTRLIKKRINSKFKYYFIVCLHVLIFIVVFFRILQMDAETKILWVILLKFKIKNSKFSRYYQKLQKTLLHLIKKNTAAFKINFY